ncbi:MAG: hypothetical protein KDD66_07990 [Bdellovibrionales bacterium]|nr:hypothetical protein [Bdellovibrionales bacterium]
MSDGNCVLNVLVLSDHEAAIGGFNPNDPVCSYVVYCMRHPDEGSEFEAYVRPLLELPDADLYARLRADAYSGLLFLEAGEIVGHVFFQLVEGCHNMFSMFLVPRCRGQRMSGQLARAFIEHSRGLSVERVRFGKGKHPKMVAALRYLSAHGAELGVCVEDAGYVEVRPAASD